MRTKIHPKRALKYAEIAPKGTNVRIHLLAVAGGGRHCGWRTGFRSQGDEGIMPLEIVVTDSFPAGSIGHNRRKIRSPKSCSRNSSSFSAPGKQSLVRMTVRARDEV